MKKSFIIFGIIAVLLIAGGYVFSHRAKKQTQEITVVKRMNVVQQVSVTGTVKPTNRVDLAFGVSGKILKVYAAVGDMVAALDTLVVLDSQDLQAQLAKARANLDQLNVDNVQRKADADLESAYTAGLTAAQKSASDGKIVLLTLTDLQYAHFSQNDQDGLRIGNAKASAIQALLGAANAGWWTADTISVLKGGAFGTTQTAIVSQTHEHIDAALSQTLAALELVKSALDAIPVNASFSAAEKTNLNAAQDSINSEIITLVKDIQAISVQKVTNNNAIVSTTAQIEAAKAAIQSIQAQIAQTQLISPIAGMVTRQDAKRGEIATANTVLVSLLTPLQFEIETQVPEADIAKVKMGNPATLTLDAYGNGTVFLAKVIRIDPAEIIVDGVATYKVTFTPLEQDNRFRSGLTANIDIVTEEHKSVLAIPSRAIRTQDGKKFVLLVAHATLPEQRPVAVGLRGSDGNTEVISGLEEGEKVIVQ